MKRYRLKYAGGFADAVGITIVFLTGVLAPVALILLIDLIEIHQIESAEAKHSTPSTPSTESEEPVPDESRAAD